MRISGFQWFLCGVAALAVHAALFLIVRPPSTGAEVSLPVGPTIEMADSLAGIIGAAVEVDSPDVVDVIDPVEPEDVAEPEVTPEPVSQVAMTAPVPPPADLPDLVQIPTSEPVEEVEIKELAPPVVKVKPVETKTEPKKQEPPKKKTAKKKKTEKVTKKKTKKKKAARKGNSKTGAGGKSKKRASSAAIAAYGGKVRARVASRARGGSGRGTVMVSFSISASGSLSSARVSRSSGNPGLDNKALSAVRSASPFPKPPAGARRSFSIPIRFR